jgi:phosphatidylglycerophosphate synthase
MDSNVAISLAQIKASYPAEARRVAPLWEKYVLRPLSFPVTWVLLKLGFSANQVTFFSGIAVILGMALMLMDNQLCIISGALLFNLWALLDCVDGNIARIRGTASKSGTFVDSIAGYLAWGFVFLAAGAAAENTRDSASVYLNGVNFLLVGALTSICNLIMRLLYQHYALIIGQHIYGVGTPQRQWAREVGLTGFLMPALLVCAILGLLHWLILFYAAFHTLALGIFILKTVGSLNRD